MKESLHAEIVFLANRISKMKSTSSLEKYYDLIVELFEKIILLKNNFKIEKSNLENQLEKNNVHLISEQTNLINVDDKNTVQPLMETIKEMIPEMLENKFESNILNQGPTNFSFQKKESSFSDIENKTSTKLNDQFAKIFKVDVNDRSAFIKKLFDNKTDEYEKVMKKISSIHNWKLIDVFINNEVKPKYKSWKDNLKVEKRFFNIIKKQFN
jgi:uncharacterized protein with von Willebrand factor type A (vWA) domain